MSLRSASSPTPSRWSAADQVEGRPDAARGILVCRTGVGAAVAFRHPVRVPSEHAGPARGLDWEWDPSLYAGSAAYYATGRVAYPEQVAEALVAALELDGSGRLLDVGCGPGSLTLLLAPHFEQAIGVDADADMLR